MTETYLRYSDLEESGLLRSRATLSRLIREQGFPPPYRLGGNSVVWKRSEVDAWIDARREDAEAVSESAA